MSENSKYKQIIYYLTTEGRCPYHDWFQSLDYKTQAIIENRIERVRCGLYGDCKRLTDSMLSELRINYGKGYRVYYKDLTNVILVIFSGSDKSNQDRAIKLADKYLKDFIERNKR